MTVTRTHWWGGLLAALAAMTVHAQQALDVPYVPTPVHVVDAMLDLGKVGSDDYLIDLGSGDGRIPLRAAERFGIRAVGVDLDPALVGTAREAARQQGVADKVRFEVKDVFDTDVSSATIVTTYLLNAVNIRLRPALLRQLRPGTRIVSHDFGFGDWQPDRQIRVDVPVKAYGLPYSDVMLWVVPANAAGRWTWTGTVAGLPVAYEAHLMQRFQIVSGEVRQGGRRWPVTEGRVDGQSLRLVLLDNSGGQVQRKVLTGLVSGNQLTGSIRTGEQSLPLAARRTVADAIDIGAPAAVANDHVLH